MDRHTMTRKLSEGVFIAFFIVLPFSRVIGTGNIGKAFAKILGFGCKVLALI
jgi:hypothetical protein